MEQPETTETAFDEYMAMDADEWLELDIYEHGETPVVGFNGKVDSSQHDSGPDSRGQKREELKKEKAEIDKPHQNTRRLPSIPLPDRYITIRRPPMNANRGLRDQRDSTNLLNKLIENGFCCSNSTPTAPQPTVWPSTAPQPTVWLSTAPQTTAWPSTAPQTTAWPSTAPQTTAWPSTAPQTTTWPSTAPQTTTP
ncbi:hypothetical protein JOQ06_005648 [Pogonophryne albipinna]|uniref:Uncharacterized protein n=1 Tax=Pogonophryne albipinna TaxID=1090488 RepID=A0AAD6BI17_9TELE|nr:hypothetical protein JOQ06_005648 [Pogonophryne albipinna]